MINARRSSNPWFQSLTVAGLCLPIACADDVTQPPADAGTGADAGAMSSGDAGLDDTSTTGTPGTTEAADAAESTDTTGTEAPPACGDGVVDLGEQCDDGNNIAGDGCSSVCTDEVCGNGILDPGEGCEDGNDVDGDGCSSSCQVEQGAMCGDGVVDLGEQCDDGNNIAGDGCSPVCTDEVCGNGILDPGEGCEDGNAVSGDGCSESCQVEVGVICGDGDLDPGEQCDDGNRTPGDGCSPICTDEVCGNGILDPGEGCEDGNTVDGDGCSAECQSEVGVECGDGNVDPGEQCDDGNELAGDGCSPVCTDEVCGNGILDPGEGCEDGNIAPGDGCSPSCQFEVCGNGVVDPGEECDDGDVVAGDGCSAACTMESCGDGILDVGEGCDDGNLVGGDGCSTLCTLEICGNGVTDAGEQCDDGNVGVGDGCSDTCTLEVCGNGVIDFAEGCDDGNVMSGDGCSSACDLEICGNGIVDPGEQCDDGNLAPADGCSGGCTLEVCGNGIVDPGEQCDDGNLAPGDGCDDACQLEVSPQCGNGVVDPGEQCDDGNLVDTDACLSSCMDARCGDGVVWPGTESCDDGNVVGGDGCSASCVSESCGNGVIELDEQCDDGAANGAAGGTCFGDCTLIDAQVTTRVIDIDLQAEGQDPRAIEAGDFNNDGHLDLATANRVSNDVSVLYGFGDGRFWAPHLRTTGLQPNDVEVADLDGDGRLDAVVANSNSNSVSVFLGGEEAFFPGTAFSTLILGVGLEPHAVAIADLTGDGELDVVSANLDSDSITLLEGDGLGGFFPLASLSTSDGVGGLQPRDIQVADVNGDGVLDLVTCQAQSDDISLLRGHGGGAFAPAVTFTNLVGVGGIDPQALVLADVSGDGVPDAITANSSSDDIVVHVANPMMDGFEPPVRVVTLDGATGNSPVALAVGDVTGDGLADVVTANLISDDVTVLAGLGAATFALPESYTTVAGASTGLEPNELRLVDANGDGAADIVTANRVTDDVSVLLNAGAGTFGAPRAFESRTGYDGESPRGLAAGDFNQDGWPDVVVSNFDTSDITVVAGLGQGRLAPSQTTNIIGSGPRGIGLGDITGDGALDWMASISNNDTMCRGGSGLSGQFTVNCWNIDDGPYGVAVGDIDEDTDLDVVIASTNDDAVTRSRNNGGSFDFNGTPLPGSIDNPFHVVLADVDGDMLLDSVGASTLGHLIQVHIGDGLGNFAAPASFTTAAGAAGLNPTFLAVADLTGDGIVDVVTSNADSNDVSLLAGLGDGSFAEPQIIVASLDPSDADTFSVRVGDLDGDGVLDLVTSNRNLDTVSVMFGFGGGVFSAPQEFAVGDQPYQMTVGDFDGDGLDDIASADSGEGTVTVLLSRGHG